MLNMKNDFLKYIFNKKTIHLFFVITFALSCANKIPAFTIMTKTKDFHINLNLIVLIVSSVAYVILEILLQIEYYRIQIYKNKIEEQNRSIAAKNLTLFKSRANRLKANMDNSTIDTKQFWEHLLCFICNNHSFSEKERISIYKITKNKSRKNIDDDCFNIIGRYSKNPVFCDTRRKTYPANCGVIGIAYKNGSCYENKLPEYSRNESKYLSMVHSKYNIDEKSIKAMNMKSCAYGAFVVKSEEDIHNEFILVFESISKESEKFNLEKLKNIVELYKEPLSVYIKKIDHTTPSLNFANEMGY